MRLMLLRLACRNALRNRKRSVITLLTISAGLGAMVFGQGMLLGIGNESISNIIDYQTAHVVITAHGYLESAELSPFSLPLLDERLVVGAVAGLPRVEGVTPRLSAPVLLYDGVNELPCLGVGVDVETERRVFRLADAVTAGRYLEGEGREVVPGAGLAQDLGLGPGDRVVLIAPGKGALDGVEFAVAGIVDTGNPLLDRGFVFIPLSEMQAVLGAKGRATEVAVRFKQAADAVSGKAAIEEALASRGLKAKVSLWSDLAREFIALHRLKKRAFGIMTGIIVFLAAVGIANTMLMASFERTREMGMMMAVGMRARRVLALFLLEGALLGLVGGIAGDLLGGALTYYLEVKGIDISAAYGGIDIGYPIRGVLRADLTASVLIYTLLFGVVVSTLASLYPAWRASRLVPSEALRYV